MIALDINHHSRETLLESFDKIAIRFFNDFQLQVNESFYRLIDIEFYFFSEGIFEDIYAHKHEAQLQKGKWYFHGSGIDITFGNGKDHGGILIRAIAKISNEGDKEKNFIVKEIHGPLNVKTEICSNLHGVFDNEANTFQLNDISRDRMAALMKMPPYIVKTKRIGLNPAKEINPYFHSAKLRYIVFPALKLKDKTQIALDMRKQYPDMAKAEINKALGSIFLK
jgi:hypothetical protein